MFGNDHRNVLQVTKNLADGGRTVACTIHSPTPHAFALFDELMLLVKGENAYYGPIGFEGESLLKYFNQFDLPPGK